MHAARSKVARRGHALHAIPWWRARTTPFQTNREQKIVPVVVVVAVVCSEQESESRKSGLDGRRTWESAVYRTLAAE